MFPTFARPEPEDPFEDGEPAFKNIPRGALLSNVRERKADASKINQNPSSLCGPASLMFLTAKHRPQEYAHFVIELYEKGVAWLRKLKIEPGSDCKNHTLQQMAAADWVALAGVRDSENTLLDYDDEDDEAAGITLPSTLAGWLEKAGYKDLINETNLLFNKDEANLREANQRRAQGYEVCLLIKAHVLNPPNSDFWPWPDHWVVLTSDITINAGRVNFTVFTWGNGKFPVDKPLSEWLDHFYGYVACKV
jgi:hypothetical protein